jgi:hypothetical protein
MREVVALEKKTSVAGVVSHPCTDAKAATSVAPGLAKTAEEKAATRAPPLVPNKKTSIFGRGQSEKKPSRVPAVSAGGRSQHRLFGMVSAPSTDSEKCRAGCTGFMIGLLQLPLHVMRAFSSVAGPEISSPAERRYLLDTVSMSAKEIVNVVVWRRSMMAFMIIMSLGALGFQAYTLRGSIEAYKEASPSRPTMF